ncbi:energy transducer TonB [Fulvivirga sediminis]|uniref:TonB C-terminal domain-containing protein n=1 Tax=Fulvivirga sediminis TaxID=2803949 RepID=A0A937F4L8_9BACT|nr:hypothetical protein [Fulvivirga sediminis]MBL3656301.1 hypothetical protein [Fulvivirga sediminis]
MPDINNIHLAFPCDQNRKTLNKKGVQFNCSKCQNQVHDFTKKSDEELNNKLTNTKRPVCGIFKTSQLSKDFLKYASVSLLVSTMTASSACSQTTLSEHTSNEEFIISETNEEFLGIIVEAPATAEEGWHKFYNSIYNNIKLSEHIPDTSFKVFVSFDVTQNGDMININVIKGGSVELNKIIIKTFKNENYHFIPAKQKGIEVSSRMVVPLIFK